MLHVSPNLKSGHQSPHMWFETHENEYAYLLPHTRNLAVYTTPKLNSQVSSARATLKNKFVGFVLVEIVMRHLRKVVFQILQI